MSRSVPHIVGVSLPDLPLMALEIEGVPQSAGIGTTGGTTVVVRFGDGSVYRYPRVPLSLALALRDDPEGAFPNIKFWPGYVRIR